jgi:hypothetical protein
MFGFSFIDKYILNENGEISQNLILDKLKYKNNWISEFICLKKAIPNEWYHTLQAQNSIKSVVNFQKDKLIVNGKCIVPLIVQHFKPLFSIQLSSEQVSYTQ